MTYKNRLESDGVPFRCATGQAVAQAERWATDGFPREDLHSAR
jgi:hypothetical protein